MGDKLFQTQNGVLRVNWLKHRRIFDFDEVEIMLGMGAEVLDVPVVILGDYVVNNGIEDENKTGWLAGIRIGKVKMPFSWDFRYIYRRVETGAVLGMYTDSDFIGGGTDGEGHEIGANIAVFEHVKLGATYFNNEIGLNESNTTDYRRLQIDLKMKF